MIQFWEEHSQNATVEEMMLDASARLISKEEKPEIISLLPCIDGLSVLELGAGIGRFTGHIAKLASHVTAVDFMQNFIDKNRKDNGYRGNITFVQADVTQLELPNQSFDFISLMAVHERGCGVSVDDAKDAGMAQTRRIPIFQRVLLLPVW
ncbi:hypothetical protein FKM82_020117, partial [Ascaphus truei]